MKVYIAAPWPHKQAAIEASEKFTQAGFEVTTHWTEHEGDSNDSAGSSLTQERLIAQAQEDINDVLRSDVFVVLNLACSEGKAVETGIALIIGLPIIFVGPRTNIFHGAFGTGVATVEEAIEKVAGLEGRG